MKKRGSAVKLSVILLLFMLLSGVSVVTAITVVLQGSVILPVLSNTQNLSAKLTLAEMW